jgi:hypothetical protein
MERGTTNTIEMYSDVPTERNYYFNLKVTIKSDTGKIGSYKGGISTYYNPATVVISETEGEASSGQKNALIFIGKYPQASLFF